MSIRDELILILLVFAAAPMITIGFLGFTHARGSLEEARIAGLESTADLKVEKIEAFFQHLTRDIDSARRLDSVQENLPILANVAGDPLNPAYGKAKEEPDGDLVVIQRTSGLADVLLADVDGRVVYSSNEAHPSAHVGGPLPGPDGKAFEEGKGGVYLGEIFPSQVFPNQFAMVISAPVHGHDGSFVGVIAFQLDMDPLYDFVQETTGLGETGETLIARETEGGALFLNPLRHDPGAALTRQALFGEAQAIPIQEALQGRDGSGQSIDYRGEKVLAVWRHIPSLDWGMVAKIDASEAFESVTNLRDLGLIVGGAILLASVFVAAAVSRTVVRPIRSLEEGARIVGSGNLDHRVGTTTKDEIGRLSRAFDEMTSDLKSVTASRDELDREVRNRLRAEEEREALIAELEGKNAELEQFTYTVSHDLKSPLITITGFLGLLAQDADAGDAERMRADMDRIADAAGHMKELLDELLELSRVGLIVGSPEQIPLGDVAREAVALVEGQAAERDVRVTIATGLPFVYGDRRRVREVLQNLIENAIKFTGEQPSPRVEVGARREDGVTVCYVRDNGMGINPRYHGKVFDLFDQLDQTSEGMGLGLALVKRITEVHGGRVWVESEGLGHGSTFCFTLGSNGQAPDVEGARE